MREIVYYCTPWGKKPFSEWFLTLDDSVKAKVDAYIVRLALGQTSNVKSVGAGVLELKIHSGPGYRIYFSYWRNQVILLLLGGTKSGQERDIRKAIENWRDFCEKK